MTTTTIPEGRILTTIRPPTKKPELCARCVCVGPLSESDADGCVVIRKKEGMVPLWKFYPNGHIVRRIAENDEGNVEQEWTDKEAVLFVQRTLRDLMCHQMFPKALTYDQWFAMYIPADYGAKCPKYAPDNEIDDIVNWAVDYAQRTHFAACPGHPMYAEKIKELD